MLPLGRRILGHGVLEAPQAVSKIIYEPENDLILCSCRTLGLIGTFALLAMVATLVYMGFAVALMCRSQFARLLAMGAALNFGPYATINTMIVLSMLPVVGMPFAPMSQRNGDCLYLDRSWINQQCMDQPRYGFKQP